jgi:putative membrane protein
VSEPEPTQTPEHQRNRRELARTGALVLLAVLMTLFAVLNLKEVQVNWIFGKTNTPLIIVIVVSLLVGILLTHFAELRYRRKR